MNRMSASNSARASRGLFATALLALLSLTLAGCGGSSPTASAPMVSPQAKACATCGTAMVSITDQPGDFVSYIVKIDSLTLTRSDGTVVQTVPVTTQVDFTQLVNLSEIVSADQIPAGHYVAAALTLDYSGATLVVDTGSGNVTVAPSDIINGATGQPVSAPITVKLALNTDDELVITQGTVANLALDFNLLASNTVSLGTPVTVTVNPVLTASLTPDATKQIHVRGPLVSVDTGASDYVVNVRPFEDSDDTTGQVTVDTTSSTTYLINGASYTGSAGLAQLATLATGTLTSAYGTWDRSTGTFTASNVLAGSSVVGPTGNSVMGTVTARSGDTLTVANTMMYFPEAEGEGMRFSRQVTVTVGPGTAVFEEGQSGAFDFSDISVGQRVRLEGTAGTDSSGNPTLDATSGNAALLPTTGVGLVTGSGAGTLTVNLQMLGNMSASALDFAGTGASPSQDATASAYEVAVPSSLSMTPANGAAVAFLGFVTAFAKAPPDFNARTLETFGTGRAELDVRWASPGVAAPFSILTGSELLLSQTTLASSTEHDLEIGPASIDPSTLSGGLELLPDTTATDDPSFAIGHAMSDTEDTFSTFNDMATALATDLNGTTAVLRVFAEGSYSTSGELTVDRLIVVLNN